MIHTISLFNFRHDGAELRAGGVLDPADAGAPVVEDCGVLS